MSEDEAEEEPLLEEEVDMLVFADCFEGVESKVGEEKEVWVLSFSKAILISSRSMRIS